MRKARLPYKQEVRGSSPRPPTNNIKRIRTEGGFGGTACDVDCDVTAQLTASTAG